MMAQPFLEGPEFHDAREQLWREVEASDAEETTLLADLWNERMEDPPFRDVRCPVLLVAGAEDAGFLHHAQVAWLP